MRAMGIWLALRRSSFSNCSPTCRKAASLARLRVSWRMGRTIPYAVTAAKAVTSTNSAVSHTRMLRCGLKPSLSFDERYPLRQEPRAGFLLCEEVFLAENIPDAPCGVGERGVPGVGLYLLAEVADVDD